MFHRSALRRATAEAPPWPNDEPLLQRSSHSEDDLLAEPSARCLLAGMPRKSNHLTLAEQSAASRHKLRSPVPNKLLLTMGTVPEATQKAKGSASLQSPCCCVVARARNLTQKRVRIRSLL